jgi:transcriptional regulator with XRE-family HTH domain
MQNVFGLEIPMNNYFTSQSKVPTAAVLGMSMILFSTGSIYPLEQAKNWVSYIKPRVSFVLDTTSAIGEEIAYLDVRKPAEHIENIRHIFNISISDLADFMGVSRQAIYKWLTGSSVPEQAKQDRIITLSRIADEFQAAGISRVGSLLKMKAFGGRSLLDILLTGENPMEYIAALIHEARVMEASYRQSGLSSSTAQPTNDWQSSISIPGFPEEK